MQLETARSSSKCLPEASPRSQKPPRERLLAAKSKKLQRSSSKNLKNHERLMSDTSLARKKCPPGAEVIGCFTSKTSASAAGTILSCKRGPQNSPQEDVGSRKLDIASSSSSCLGKLTVSIDASFLYANDRQ